MGFQESVVSEKTDVDTLSAWGDIEYEKWNWKQKGDTNLYKSCHMERIEHDQGSTDVDGDRIQSHGDVFVVGQVTRTKHEDEETWKDIENELMSMMED